MMSDESSPRAGRGWRFRAGLASVVLGVAVLSGANAAQAASGWASHNVYCYENWGGSNSTREFIRNVYAYTSGSDTYLDYVLETQSWNGSSYARGSGMSHRVTVTRMGGMDVLGGFTTGDGAIWVCQQFSSYGLGYGSLTSDS
jgi:hypothetical protein